MSSSVLSVCREGNWAGSRNLPRAIQPASRVGVTPGLGSSPSAPSTATSYSWDSAWLQLFGWGQGRPNVRSLAPRLGRLYVTGSWVCQKRVDLDGGGLALGEVQWSPQSNRGWWPIWTRLYMDINTDSVCVLLCAFVCFFFNNQTIVYICTLARGHKEEHPNNEEKSQTGEWAGWERKSRYFAFSPHGWKDFKFTMGEGETRGQEGPLRNYPWIQKWSFLKLVCI